MKIMKKKQWVCYRFSPQKGQVIIEYILLMAMLFALVMLVFSFMKGSISRVVNQPKALFQGLSRSGSWVRYQEGRLDSSDLEHHPANIKYHLQTEGRK